MPDAPVLDPAIVAEIKTILTEHQDKKFVTQDDYNNSTKATDAKLVSLFTEQEAKFEIRLKEQTAAHERFVKEKLAKNPGLMAPTGDLDARSIGTRFVEHADYKAWAAADRSGKFNLQWSIKGRLQSMEHKGTITEAGSGVPLIPVRIGTFAAPTLPLRMRDLMTVVPISGTNAIEYVIETWTYNADYQVAEGDLKAQGDVTYVPKTAMVRTIAWYVKVSRQMLADAAYFAATIDSQLLYGVAKKEDREILFGDNGAGHLHGIMPQATALPADVIDGILYTADQVRAAIAYLEGLGFAPTAIVLNPVDWASMQVAKTAQGVYILGGPPASNSPQTLWGLPVVTTSEMTAGQFLVGAFPPNAALFDRETATVDLAYENEDDFIRNLVTIRCEERIALAVYRPTAFVKGTLTTAAPLAAPAAAAAHAKDRK